MFYYKGEVVKLLDRYRHDPDYEEWRREMDILVAYTLGLELEFHIGRLTGHLVVLYLKDGEWFELPYYMNDMNAALSLFANEYGLTITMNLVFNSVDKTDRPLGEWWVQYEDKENKIVYLPGSGSYYRPAEAMTRAWLAYMNIGLIHKYPVTGSWAETT